MYHVLYLYLYSTVQGTCTSTVQKTTPSNCTCNCTTLATVLDDTMESRMPKSASNIDPTVLFNFRKTELLYDRKQQYCSLNQQSKTSWTNQQGYEYDSKKKNTKKRSIISEKDYTCVQAREFFSISIEVKVQALIQVHAYATIWTKIVDDKL